jgi:WD40 repeat protein
MASASVRDAGRHLRLLYGPGSVVGLDDGQLLERFVAASLHPDQRAAAEAAFETILARTALKARKTALGRQAREERVARAEGSEGPVVAEVERYDTAAMLHAEIARLPAKYRAAVVLCYLQGCTHDEAAAALNWPLGTIRCRLSRGREMFRNRLIRRGLAAALPALGTARAGSPAPNEAPLPLLRTTTDAAIRGFPPAAAVLALADAVINGPIGGRVRLPAAAVGLVATAAWVALIAVAPVVPTNLRARDPGRTPVVPTPAAREQAPVDQYGDPLPKPAQARMGTIRFNEGQEVAQVIFGPDGKSLFTASGRRGAHLWDAASGRGVRSIREGGDSNCEIAMPARRRTLAVHSYAANSLRLYDSVAGRELRRWHLPKDGRSSRPTFSPDGKILATVFAPNDRIAPNGEPTLAIGLWDTTAATERRRRLTEIPNYVCDLKISPDGTLLVLALFDRYETAARKRVRSSTQFWSIATGRAQTIFPIDKPGFGPHSLTFSPDGRRLFAGVTDQTIRVYELAAGRELTPPRDHEQALDAIPGWDAPRKACDCLIYRVMDCLTFSPDGSILATAAHWNDFVGPSPGYVPEICLWDVAEGKLLRHFPANEGLITSLSYAPDGKTTASSGADPIVRLWDVATGRAASLQTGHRSAITLVVASRVDGTLFTGSNDGTVRKWDSATGRELAVVADLPFEIEALDIAPVGKNLLVCEGGHLHLWSAAERRELRQFSRAAIPADGYAYHAVFSPDSTKVASDIAVFDLSSGKVLATFPDQKFASNQIARYIPTFFSADSRQLVRAEAEGARVWDIATGNQARWAVRSKFAVDGVGIAGTTDHSLMPSAISADRRFLATRGTIYFNGWAKERFDPAIRIWDLTTGREIAMLEGEQGRECVLAFSRAGRLLASCSVDHGNVKAARFEFGTSPSAVKSAGSKVNLGQSARWVSPTKIARSFRRDLTRRRWFGMSAICGAARSKS